MLSRERYRRKGLEDKCPPGYTVDYGESIDMLGKTELWRIFERHT